MPRPTKAETPSPRACRVRRTTCLTLCFALLALPRFARAQEPDDLGSDVPQSTTYEYSPYEQETIELVLKEHGFAVEPNPEGKIVERVEVATLEVVEPRDPAPALLNLFHTTSKHHVIDREVLVRPGQRYRKVLVDEIARNLRGLSQLSVVLTVPVRGSSPDQVVLLVITKDVWSLRLNWDASYTRGGLESLLLQPSETNVAGLHHTASGLLKMDPASISLGTGYTIPRFTSYRLLATAQANVIFNRDSGDSEGSFGGLSVGRPLVSTLSEWSWSTSTTWSKSVVRRFVDAQLATYDADATDGNDGIPYAYKAYRVLHRTYLNRSFGWAAKHDVSFGAEYDFRDYDLPALQAHDPAAVDEFRRKRVPTSDVRLSPYVQYQGYTTNFVRVLDFERLALQEDYRLGHNLILRLYPASSDVLSSRTLLGVFAAAQYTVAVLDGLVRVGVESQTESESDRLADARFTGFWHLVTPRLGFGRLVHDARLDYQYRNYLNRQILLGGNGRLRGYPSSYDVGTSLVASNLEFRTRPLELLSLQLGGAAFYDVGDAFDEIGALRIKQSVGLGIRALFPQLDRYVFRADVGFPISASPLPRGVSPWSFYVSFEQAFAVPNVEPP